MPTTDRPFVTRRGEEPRNTAQSGGLVLMTGFGPLHTPAAGLWFGKAMNAPGFRSLPHHHGPAETGAYVLCGHAGITEISDKALNSATMSLDSALVREPGCTCSPLISRRQHK
jgi:uncharacterized RmlC-like cupin family protein